jgi:hypothetical protein
MGEFVVYRGVFGFENESSLARALLVRGLHSDLIASDRAMTMASIDECHESKHRHLALLHSTFCRFAFPSGLYCTRRNVDVLAGAIS